jgi:molecular chaperone HtpG
MTETYTFQAETQQLLDILVHSLYKEREIFLRELVSNASDALNRVQFEQLTDSNIKDADADLEIRITFDDEANTLTISDTGIGMTADDMRENLGTIAKSGAKGFIEAIKEAADSEAAQNIIGQFGVGFYSAFMVADKVRVVSRSYQPDAEAAAWEADGGTEYRIEAADKDTRGTDVTLYLKDDADDFTQPWRLKNIIKRHSDYVAFPIYVGDDDEAANTQQALWRRSPREVEQGDYHNFYQMLTMDFGEPLHTIHMRADVPMQFYALMYIPGSAEMSPLSPRKEPGLKLYARKVLIDEYNTDLLPEYLQFVQGVVDSEDLPLNVSRESIRADRIIARLKSTLTSKVLNELKTMADKETGKYLDIYAEFGRALKQGVVVAPQDKDDLLPLLYFQSSHDDDPDSYHSLDDYVSRMADGQEDIYYVIADDFASARRSPHLDAFRQRDIEVLYFSDPVDAMLPMGLDEYDGHPLRSVDESDIDLSEVGDMQDDDQPEPLEEATFESVVERVQQVLGQRVSDVRQSKTLVGSPARLVSDEKGGGRHMYRINRLLDREYELPVKSLELNPRHPILHNLSQLMTHNDDNPLIDVTIEQVFETALLQDGLHPDPASMADRINALMEAATGSPESVNFERVAPPKAPAAPDTESPEPADTSDES